MLLNVEDLNINVETSIRYDHNQDPAVFKITKTMMKKQQRKNDERVGFPDISDSQAVFLRGI